MTVHRFQPLCGPYHVVTAPMIVVNGVRNVLTGLVRFEAGIRSPATGLRQGCASEVDYVVSGRLRVDTASGSYEISAGDIVIEHPDEPHATTALEDSEIFFVLMDPLVAFDG
jgi:quercetin dioxygenase-like cupin family protein